MAIPLWSPNIARNDDLFFEGFEGTHPFVKLDQLSIDACFFRIPNSPRDSIWEIKIGQPILIGKQTALAKRRSRI